MPSRLFILDEWLFHHLRGEAGLERQQEAIRILLEIEKRCDRIAWKPNTPWASKAYQLMKSIDQEVRKASKLLHSLLRDLNKAVIPSSASPVERSESLPQDDRYLLELYESARADLLVTTDQELHDRIKRLFPHVKVEMLSNFVGSYLAGQHRE